MKKQVKSSIPGLEAVVFGGVKGTVRLFMNPEVDSPTKT